MEIDSCVKPKIKDVEYLTELVEKPIVKSEMDKRWNDIEVLLKQKFSTEEIFSYASYIHLVFIIVIRLLMSTEEQQGCRKKGFLPKNWEKLPGLLN